MLRVGLTAAVTGEGGIEFDRLATLDAGQLQVLLDQVKSWCRDSHTKVVLKPGLERAAA